MIVAKTQDAAREKKLLDEWFSSVEFIEESEGIPPLDDEEDDEERALEIEAEQRNLTLSDVDMDDLMEELRKRDPDNPF